MEKLILITIPLEDYKGIHRDLLKEILTETFLNQDKEEEYLTRQETIALLKISYPTLNEWSRKGLLKKYRINSRIRYKKSEIEQALKGVPNLINRRA
jgi:hypothetical protein